MLFSQSAFSSSPLVYCPVLHTLAVDLHSILAIGFFPRVLFNLFKCYAFRFLVLRLFYLCCALCCCILSINLLTCGLRYLCSLHPIRHLLLTLFPPSWHHILESAKT